MDIITDITERSSYPADVHTHRSADDALAEFLAVRGRLIGIAYRMLGNATEAEDIVQDVWLRWQLTDNRTIRSPRAFLVTATTRLAINVLQSARVRRETGANESSPDPVATDLDPDRQAERNDAIDHAMRLLLETLSPVERAAYVLREAFSYSYREISRILRVQEANARQLVTRARARVTRDGRKTASASDRRLLRDAFLAASRGGDLSRLERLFAGVGPPA